MSATLLDVAAVRERFSSLRRPLALFDAPSGTQVPDTVVDAIAAYLRDDNANVGGDEYETMRRTNELVERAHDVAARFLGCGSGEVAFGPNMTTLNLALTRALAHELAPGDAIVVTRLDHDANVAPWLHLAHDHGLELRFAELGADGRLDLEQLEALLDGRTRVVAFPLASNALGTVTEARRIVDLAHGCGALAWADAVHYAPHARIQAGELGADALLCSPYKFFGPHLGLAYVSAGLLERLRPYKVRPAPDEPPARRLETGTQQHELLAGFVAAVDYLDSIGWEAITAAERALGERFLAGLPATCTLHGPPTMEGRVSTFALTVAGRSPAEVAAELGRRDLAVGHGNFYAVEVMETLGLPEGVVRAGLVHYHSAEEVDRLLGALEEL